MTSEISSHEKEIRHKMIAQQGANLLLDGAQKDVADWHNKRFPKFYSLPTSKQLDALLLKLAEETGETIAAFNKNETSIRLAEEAMDTMIVCLQILDVLGQGAESVFDSVMCKNNKRLEAIKT